MKELFPLSEAEKQDVPIIDWIANRVAELLDRDPELLFSYLYRLDVPESKVDEIIKNGGQKVSILLAKLILQRQKQRQETKKSIDVPKDIDTLGMEW